MIQKGNVYRVAKDIYYVVTKTNRKQCNVKVLGMRLSLVRSNTFFENLPLVGKNYKVTKP
jgi:hypothetical protein